MSFERWGISTKVKPSSRCGRWRPHTAPKHRGFGLSALYTSTKTTGARTTNKNKSSYSVIKALLYGRLSGGNNSWSTGVLHWLKLMYACASTCQCRVTLIETCVQLTFCSFFQACAFYALGCYGRPRCPPALTNCGRAADIPYISYNISKAQPKRLRNKTVSLISPLSFFVAVHGISYFRGSPRN